jgi:hypothetical protein
MFKFKYLSLPVILIGIFLIYLPQACNASPIVTRHIPLHETIFKFFYSLLIIASFFLLTISGLIRFYGKSKLAIKILRSAILTIFLAFLFWGLDKFFN